MMNGGDDERGMKSSPLLFPNIPENGKEKGECESRLIVVQYVKKGEKVCETT